MHDGAFEWTVIRQPSILGEAPVWDPVTSRLHWVDCDQKTMYRLDPEKNGISTFSLAGSPGSYAFSRDGQLLLAYRNRLSLVDLESGSHRDIATPMIDFGSARFNDGACDRAGRFWLGTMHKAMSEPVGALYRVDQDLTVHLMADGVTVSNGIAFSPDDTRLYHTDSRLAVIYVYDFDLSAGTISNRRVFADFSGRHEKPDGCTVDRDGFLWAAMLGGGRVVVLDPAGNEVRSIALPTTRPTSVCFGGKALDTLYVTTMRLGLSAEELQAQADAGCLFAGAGLSRGLPEPHFGA